MKKQTTKLNWMRNPKITSSNRSMTRFIWAPTGALRILLICWSLSVSLENLTPFFEFLPFADAFAATTGVLGFLLPTLLDAMLESVDWHFSCCFLNLSSCSCKAIFHQKFENRTNNFTWIKNCSLIQSCINEISKEAQFYRQNPKILENCYNVNYDPSTLKPSSVNSKLMVVEEKFYFQKRYVI